MTTMRDLMVGEVAASPITDLQAYLQSMDKALEEKLWFVAKLPSEVTVLADFGCGSGSLARSARDTPSGIEHLVLYDHDECMVQNLKAIGHKEATHHLGMFHARLDRHHAMGHKSCLVLSSVIHEVLSQGVSWQAFWSAVCAFGCDYIAIRDMAVTHDVEASGMRLNIERWIKNRYPNDYERENCEQYFPVTVECMLNTCTIGSGYKLKHFDHSPLPFFRAQGLGDTPTHIKMLLQRTAH